MKRRIFIACIIAFNVICAVAWIVAAIKTHRDSHNYPFLDQPASAPKE